MSAAELNVTSVTSLTLDGLVLLSDHRLLFFSLFFCVYLFVLLSDGLVVYLIWSEQSLHRPMFVFLAAVLLNSAAGSTAVYPKLLSDMMSGSGGVQVSHPACLFQAFMVFSLGASSFMLLSAMAFDRYVSICRPLRYAALVSPAAVAVLLLLCWLLPAGMVGGAVLLASRLPLCRSRLRRIYCDIYSFVRLSCSGGGGAVLLSEAYGLLCSTAVVFLPAAFVLFSYARILCVCLRRSRSFSAKALHTCLPHLLVFLNYFVSVAYELLQRRVTGGDDQTPTVISSALVVLVPSLMNPVIYGLKMKEILRHVKRLLRCQRAA